MNPQNLPAVLLEVRTRMAQAAAAAGRSAQSVTLLAVGKAQPLELLTAAADCGVSDFGESYLQEALPKIAALQERALTWHFIGRIQANKTRSIAENFAWVHALDRLKVAERLGAQRPHYAPPLNVCLQVNIAGEDTKGGIAPARSLRAGCTSGRAAPDAAPPPPQRPGRAARPARQRSWFARLRVLKDELNAAGHSLDTLSMGMSADFEAAIQEGATIVRLGTVLFGARPP